MTFLFRYGGETDVSLQPIRNLNTGMGWWSTPRTSRCTPEENSVPILRDSEKKSTDYSQAHSQPRTLTQHDMLPQHPINTRN